MPIKLDFLANTRQVEKAAGDIESTMQRVGESLDDVGRAGKDSGRDLADGLADGVRDARDDVDKLERSFADLAREARDESRKAGRALRDDVGDGADRARQAVGDMGEEAADTGREMAASFKEPADALDAVQELAANALSGLGPAGVVAGSAAAVGIGVVTTTLQGQQEEADKLAEKMGGMYQEAVEAGRSYLDEAQIIKAVNDLMFDPANKDLYQQATRDAELLGVTVNDVLLAQAGDQASVNLLIEAGTLKAQEMRDAQWGTVDANAKTAAELGGAITRYQDLAKLAEENKARAERSLELEQQLGARESGNIAQAKKGYEERWAKLQEFYTNARNGAPSVTVPVRADTSDYDRKIAALDGRTITLRVRGMGMDGWNNY